MAIAAQLSQPLAVPEQLNLRAARVAALLSHNAPICRVESSELPGGGTWIDCGIEARGGISAGLALARICMADLAEISLVPGHIPGLDRPSVQVITDHPVAACLASQYAGWALSEGNFFAMGSGPMRSAAGKEDLIKSLGYLEEPASVVGVLECRGKPSEQLVQKIAADCRVKPHQVTLAAAPTASIAGGVQIVARSVETALHKLVELGFDLSRIVSAQGHAPLPPVAKNDMKAIGRTNDAILYGAVVVIQVTGDDETLYEIGPKVPSSASRDYGEPFETVFSKYEYDFYKVDPGLFSPSRVIFENIQTGRSFEFGHVRLDLLKDSFRLPV